LIVAPPGRDSLSPALPVRSAVVGACAVLCEHAAAAPVVAIPIPIMVMYFPIRDFIA
jgi:hypothetical protein